MLKTVLKRAAVTAAATGAVLLGVSGVANAATASTPAGGWHHDDAPSVSFLNNLCVAPWQWNGPIEVLTAGHAPVYAACNGNTVVNAPGHAPSVSFLNNLCVAPWQWNGPLELLTAGHAPVYAACNGNIS